MPVLLSFRQRTHVYAVLLQPSRDGIGIAPLTFFFAIKPGNLYRAQLLLHILVGEPFFVLVECFLSQAFSHSLYFPRLIS